MVKFKRLSAKERKQQICQAAKKVFLEKGFKNTTMENVISASGMSKGGVYNYYGSTEEMLYDLMIQGIKFRLAQSEQQLKELKDRSVEDQLTELFFDKMFDTNEFKPLYAMFIVEMKNNEAFQELYDRLIRESLERIIPYMKENFPDLDNEYLFTNRGIIAFINSIIVGVELMDLRDDFLSEREIFRKMLKAYFKYCEERNENERKRKNDDLTG